MQVCCRFVSSSVGLVEGGFARGFVRGEEEREGAWRGVEQAEQSSAGQGMAAVGDVIERDVRERAEEVRRRRSR